MRSYRTAFTLIEMMISISILSLVMMFLYQTYVSLNASNKSLKTQLTKIATMQELKKVIYLDFSLALYKSVKIQDREKVEDVVFLQSSNSIHKRHNPYVAYIVKEDKLYRLESLKEIKEYQLAPDSEFDVDYLGEVESFRVYKSTDEKKEVYLVHVDFKKFEDVLLKIKVLNEN